MPLENLTRSRIVEALNRLGQKAEREAVQLEVCIYGGSAMLLAYGARETTKDVDAIIRPSNVAARLVAEVARELSLHDSWLNDTVRRFVSDAGTFAPLEIQELETAARQHLKITRPSASYLLAMKCLACRAGLPGYPGDIEDIRFLIGKMNLRTLNQVEDHVARFYPHDSLTASARAIIEGLLPKPEVESE
ncbi:MAG: DUF6036 family nucleotidyltransferase [Verrucomicrobiales bacterium]|nr:DUF6036 family nucleotidyltransferase [Verrucomicrobiales bacterium]